MSKEYVFDLRRIWTEPETPHTATLLRFPSRTDRPRPAIVSTDPQASLREAERLACRSERMDDLERVSNNARRDAITRLWILSGCKACGSCPDMVAT